MALSNRDRSEFSQRIREGLWAIREKDVRSTTLERLRLTREADELLHGRPQPEQLSEGLYYLLDRVSLPVSPNDLLLGRVAEEVPDAEGEAFFRDTIARWDGRGTPSWMPDGGHECFDWARILELGLPGLQGLAEGELARRREAGERGAHVEWVQCSVHIYEAFRNYARRYAEAAQHAGMRTQAEQCAAVADRAPRSFAEGLQLIWLVAQVYCTFVARNPTLTLGRLDQLLLDLYRRDTSQGRLTRKDAAALVEDFYAKNTLILGRGEHQMNDASGASTGWARNLAYDAPQYMLLGGRRTDGSSCVNELTELFLEGVVPALENPVIVLRYTRGFPDDVWRIACDKMRANASMIVYNDEVVVDSFRRIGIPDALATDYAMYGCNWPVTAGKSRSIATKRIVLPQHVMNALTAADSGADLDGLYSAFARSVSAEIRDAYDEHRRRRQTSDERAPGPLRVDDCFLDGPVERARSWQLGGTPITTLTVSLVGTATAADCFSAVEHVVLRGDGGSIDSLRAALRADFEGWEPLRRQCLAAPKFGANDARADAHAARMLNIVLDEIDRLSGLGTSRAVPTFRSLTSDMTHRRFGAEMGATPDGRRAGEPISENMSPNPGACRDGLSSLLRSMARLPFERIQSGALNVRIDPRTTQGDEGLGKLASALRTYFDLGGLQCQLSFASVAELCEARRNPEAHRDLMVRITGYSAVFVDMGQSAQKEIIRRAEMGV